jgi:hypothetical protein
MLTPQRRALFEASYSALTLRSEPGDPDALAAPGPTASATPKPASDLHRPGQAPLDRPRRRRMDAQPRRPRLIYDQEAGRFHYVWPPE